MDNEPLRPGRLDPHVLFLAAAHWVRMTEHKGLRHVRIESAANEYRIREPIGRHLKVVVRFTSDTEVSRSPTTLERQREVIADLRDQSAV